ncbi:phosphoribosyltransferase [Actinomadura rayongensis]|uniref:Phosphoribosyltransferase n=1 Tax=Actinomadura rayongensis TaxID=1429076 RepID=A0A6I4W5X4_9ACTN|nr:phosphoribosyltransferase family protein [Actinomadura rayongensis]MXQ64918.1 phosphoribosyltransferase [Actinomadura rayongensis]
MTSGPNSPQRIFEGRRIWCVTAPAFVTAIRLIADAERAFEPDTVVGIRRGGAPPASALAELMDVPCAHVAARHNASDQIALPATGRVGVDIAGLRRPAGRVLLVDDICGSGATLDAVGAALARALDPELVRTATLCRNVGATTSPDVWVWDVADWTVFPWEASPSVPVQPLPMPTEVMHP